MRYQPTTAKAAAWRGFIRICLKEPLRLLGGFSKREFQTRTLPAGAGRLTTASLAWIINLKMNLTSRNVCAGWWRWHLDAPACAPAL